MSIFILRLFQQGLLFLSVFLTLTFGGEEVYIKFNEIIFILSILTCFIQPIINSIWRGGLRLNGILNVVFVLLLGLLPIGLMHSTSIFLIIIYLSLRMLERFFYIDCAINNGIYRSQKSLCLVYFFELMLLLFLWLSSKNDIDLAVRLMATILAYSITLVFILIFNKEKFLHYFNIKTFPKDALKLGGEFIRSLGSFFYFLLFTILTGIDRLYIQNFSNNQSLAFDASYLFYLSIFIAFFGLCTFNFDQIRKTILDKKEIKYMNFIVPVFFGFLIIALALCVFNTFLVDFLKMLKVPSIDLIEIIYLSAFVFSIYIIMLVSTSFIQAGKFFLPTFIGFLLVVIKVTISYLFDVGLANIVASSFAVLFSVSLYKKMTISTKVNL